MTIVEHFGPLLREKHLDQKTYYTTALQLLSSLQASDKQYVSG